MKISNDEIIKQAKLELARREFFFYCHLKAPDFYKPDRKYLVDLCNSMQEFYEGDDEVLIINLPPRMGKSRSAGLFVEWVLGRNQEEKIMTIKSRHYPRIHTGHDFGELLPPTEYFGSTAHTLY